MFDIVIDKSSRMAVSSHLRTTYVVLTLCSCIQMGKCEYNDYF